MSRKFSIQLKPVGSFCNLTCTYCYVKPFQGKSEVMSEDILRKVIRNCLQSNPEPTISWHGGEPMCAGLDFFRQAVKFMRQFASDFASVRNIVQTNATLITEEFAQFFAENNFGVSVSLDGPAHIHGRHRVFGSGRNSHESVEHGIYTLRKAGISPSVICTVTKQTLPYAEEVFRYLVDLGFKRIKYSPVYDSGSDSFSISNEEWFEYLRQVFDAWFGMGDSEIEVRELDEVILWMQGETLNLCTSDKSCLSWVSVDPQGNLYPCEYLRANHSYGNISQISFSDIEFTPAYQDFQRLFLSPPPLCSECSFFKLCGNGCPATRILHGKLCNEGVYVYCQQRKMLYNEIKRRFESVLGEEI